MTPAEIIEKFAKAPNKYKAFGVVGVSIFLAVVYYFLFYSEISGQVETMDNKIVTIQQEMASYEEKKQRYLSFRAEVNKLLEEQKELVKVLPTEKKIYSFIQSLHAQGELSGLSITKLIQEPEQQQNFYAKIPVKMSIKGTFHQLKKFFYSIGKLKRIVNIQNLELKNPKYFNKGVILRADFLASTFRFIDPKKAAPPNPQGG